MKKIESHENKEHKEVYSELEQCRNSQKDIYSYLTKFDDRILRALHRNKNLLKVKYLTMMGHLEKLKKQLAVYEEKVMRLEKDIDENENIKKLIAYINIYKTYSSTLLSKFMDLDARINQEEAKISENLALVQKKKRVIFQVNHENLIFSDQIMKYKNFLSQHKSLILPHITNPIIITENSSILSMPSQINNSSLFESKDKVEQVIKNIKLIEKRNSVLKRELTQKAFNFNENKKLFEEAFEILFKNVVKSQEVVKSDGLKGSLLFEIKKSKITDNIKDSFNIGQKGSSKLQEREAKNVIYKTLNVIIEKQEEKKPSNRDKIFKGLCLDWETFKVLEAKQIMALLSVSPEIIDEIKKKMEMKKREIKEITDEVKKIN